MRASKSYSDPGLENGFNSLIGFELIEWRSDHAVLQLVIESKHLNRSGVIHGGVLATMIDAACGYAGCYCETPGNVRAALTLSLTTSYLGSTSSGVLHCTAKKRGGGRRIFNATAEILTEDGAMIALGQSTYRYRSGSEDPAGVPRKKEDKS